LSVYPVKRTPPEHVRLAPMVDRPLISVIVPSFNQGHFIRATLDSILAQYYRPIEILVIDGASTDATVDVLRSYGDIPELRWVSEPDSGVVEAVNKGFARARGDIVAIQSSDDRYLPGALAAIMQVFREQPELGLVYGDTVKVDATGREIQRYRIGPWSLENLYLLKTWIPQPSCFFRRELLETCGGWDERIPYTPDTDLWIRMAFRTEVRKIDEYLSERRVHDAQRDVHADRILRDYRQMIAQSPDIAAAPPALRRAARAGAELMYRRYNATGSQARALWHDLKGMAICPRAFDARRLWVYALLMPLRTSLRSLAPFKRWLGCWVNERWRTELALSSLGQRFNFGWRDLCNRHERVEPGDDAGARYVATEYTSYLTVARMFPRVGGRLAAKCFEEHPLPTLSAPELQRCQHPRISIVLPVGGSARLPGFRCVLAALANQSLRALEIIVVEHSVTPDYAVAVPEEVRYEHVPMAGPNEEFNKSMLLNRGVALARAPLVLLHDADILVPRDYLEQALRRIDAGFEAVRPLRLLFYLDSIQSRGLIASGNFATNVDVPVVTQNFQGGSTLLVRDVYGAIGGHDERFRGWGGEDLEFLERLQTRKLFKGGIMPGLHLWHEPGPKKASGDRNNQLLDALRSTAPLNRAQKLGIAQAGSQR
jgi:glycosyltransferase involved in cell wall biosynthesis